jgi:4-alpha-glucanotransferase
MRKAGVLLPISAQVSEFGIGDMGMNSKMFIDFIAQMGFKIWQVLPINIVGAGNSPYSGLSSFAGNPLLIDLMDLKEVLSADEIRSAEIDSPYRVDYGRVRENKTRLLNLAYTRLDDEYKRSVLDFVEANKSWLIDYATFMVIREVAGKSWYDWDDDLKFRESQAIKKIQYEYADKLGFYYFEQYMFYKQWFDLKSYANSIGVEIMGDIPIYVSYDSADVWANPKEFQLDADLKPTALAGVPPDYFAQEGQFWGNPIYNYDKMSHNNFSWLVDRITKTAALYDYLRLDHFRGLCEYWSIPNTASSAKEGEWKKGPGLKLWNAINKKNPEIKLVAEDLGIIDEKVIEFREQVGIPSMNVFHFAFDGDINNSHLIHNLEKHKVVYSATHDNDTTLGWLYSLDYNTREKALEYVNFRGANWGAGGRDGEGVKAILRSIIASVAEIVIFPFQDLCAYGSDTRTNIPGIPEGNWEYRCTLSAFDDIDTHFYHSMLRLYGRA